MSECYKYKTKSEVEKMLADSDVPGSGVMRLPPVGTMEKFAMGYCPNCLSQVFAAKIDGNYQTIHAGWRRVHE